jgi:hypothetical protein
MARINKEVREAVLGKIGALTKTTQVEKVVKKIKSIIKK